MAHINHPLIFIINKLYTYSYYKEDLLKILACLRRTCKELKYYINKELDRSKFIDPIYQTLWRYENKKTVIYNNFADYNKYLSKKNTDYNNIYIENADSSNLENNIKLNKLLLNKNIKHTFNIFIVNCKIDRQFCYTSKNEYKTVNLYMIKCTITKRSYLIDKCSYGNLNLIKCNLLPRIYIDNQEYLYINRCKSFDYNILSYNNIYRSYNRSYLSIIRCKNVYIYNSQFLLNEYKMIDISPSSNLLNIELYNNIYYLLNSNINNILLIENKSKFNNIFNNIINNYAFIINYNNLKFTTQSINLQISYKEKKKKIKKIINNYKPTLYISSEYNHYNKKFLNKHINILSLKLKKNIEVIITTLIKYFKIKIDIDLKFYYKKKLESYNLEDKNNIINQIDKYITPDIKYVSKHLSDSQMFNFLYINK